ncbi:MAG: hypothetical protein CMK32_02575 [Porticoccaceae bacterium]|nr:hypothetical protein [Porticoccaceae bacterium]
MSNRKRVFLSYCHADIEVASNIERRLRDDSIEVLSSFDLDPGSNIQTNLKYFVESSDIVLLLLSKAYFNSVYSGKELYEFLDESNKRKVTVIPVAIERCNIPWQLKNLNTINLYSNIDSGIELLKRQINVLTHVSFDDFSAKSFEEFTYLLLREYGFKNIKREFHNSDYGIDFIAEAFTKNPFGSTQKETWIVEVKFYRNERFSINTIQQLFEYKRRILPHDSKMLLITNSILTSVAEEYLSDLQKHENTQIEVIDGIKLKKLIAKRKKLINEFLPS